MTDKKKSSVNRRILQIAIPSIISNITVPLLGLIDVTIVGHLGSPAYIGAIAVGGMLFNIIYWIFGFLRMGTSGMTSQAYGQHDLNEITRLLLRSVGVGLFIALCLLILQYPILKLAFTLIQTTPEVKQLATTYFYICIWGAPATLGLYGFAGWFIGMQNSRFPMYIAITQNIVNIVASLCFVYLLDMKVAGVATGTLIAQYAGFFMAILLYMRYYSVLKKRIIWKEIIQKQAMYRFFQVNRDIFFRTLCLVIVTMFFTSAGAAQGEIVLAVNTLLMQLFTLFSYIMGKFSGIENLCPRNGSCPLHFGERCFTMDIEIKRMSSDTIELFDQLNIVCKRFHVDYLHASEKDKFFVEAVALHEYQLKKAHEQGLKRADVPPFLGLKRTERSNEMPA